MDLYGRMSRSIPQKVLIIVAQAMMLCLAHRVLWGRWGAAFSAWMHWPSSSDPTRSALLMIFHVVVFGRLSFMTIVFLKRRIPLGEAISVALACGAYFVGFSLLSLRSSSSIGIAGGAGIVAFAVGSSLNTGSELLRDRWKRRPENKGHLYVGGMFRWAMHINYFGDVLWVAGYALVTDNPWSALIPVALLAFFAFYNAPKLDAHLAGHYGAEFESYARRTRRLVPFVY